MYTIIKVQCVDQNLTVIEEPVVASGGKNADVIQFTFCDLWAGMAKTAVFWHDKKPKEVYHALIGIENECIVPHEVLSVAGRFFVGVMGVKDETRRTTTTLAFTVKPGVEKKGIASAPTQTIYEQLLADYATSTAMMESIVSDARTAATTAANASADAKAAAQKAETAAEDAAKEAMAAASHTVNAAVTAAQDAQRAAEDAVEAAEAAAAAARDDVLAMGCVRYVEGTYTGSPTENQGSPSRALTLPCAPKVIFILASISMNDNYHVILLQGQTISDSRLIDDADGDGQTSYKAYVKLDGDTLKFTCDAYSNKQFASDATVTNDFLNASGKTYSYVAFY